MAMTRILISIVWMIPVIVTGCSSSEFAAKTGKSDMDLKFGDRIGLTAHLTGVPADDPMMQRLVDLGVRWIRDDSEHWAAVEPEPGKYGFSERFRKCLEFYKQNHIGILYIMCYGNKQAYPDDPFNAEAYGRYAVAVAKMFQEIGVEFVLEIWNEPHNFELGPYYGGNWNAAPPSAWADHYVKMVHEAVRQVKAYDPSVKLLNDEDVWVAHYWFLEQGLPENLDGVAVHPYNHGSPGPEINCWGADTEWLKPFPVIDQDRSMRSLYRNLRNQYTKKLGRTPEIWATEWGYHLGGKIGEEEKVTEETVAAFLPRAYIISAAENIRCLNWYVLNADEAYNLVANDGRERLSYQAFKVMSRQLGPCRLLRQINGYDHPTQGIQAFLFEGPMRYQVAAWCIEGPQEVTLETNSSWPIQAIDNLGNPVEIRSNQDHLAVIKLSRAPVYITGMDSDCAIQAIP